MISIKNREHNQIFTLGLVPFSTHASDGLADALVPDTGRMVELKACGKKSVSFYLFTGRPETNNEENLRRYLNSILVVEHFGRPKGTLWYVMDGKRFGRTVFRDTIWGVKEVTKFKNDSKQSKFHRAGMGMPASHLRISKRHLTPDVCETFTDVEAVAKYLRTL